MLSLVIVYVGLGALAPLLALAQHLRPSAQGVPSPFATSRRIDWLYWLVTPLGAGLASRAIVVALGAGVALLFGARVGHADQVLAFFAERSVMGAMPGWAQLLVCLALVDLLSYSSHRLRHSALLFPLHAVHHSSTELDWLYWLVTPLGAVDADASGHPPTALENKGSMLSSAPIEGPGDPARSCVKVFVRAPNRKINIPIMQM